MQTREKILAGGLGAVLAYWLIGPAVVGAVTGPIREREDALAAVRRSLDAAEQKELRAFNSISKLAEWGRVALPENSLAAQRAYATWIWDLADRCRLEEFTVTPGRVEPIEGGAEAVQVTIDGEATASRLAEFLSLYDGAALLHTTRRFRVDARSRDADSLLRFELVAEGVSLPGTPRRPLPYSRWTLAEDFDGSAGLAVRENLYPGIETPFEVFVGSGGSPARYRVKALSEDTLSWEVAPVDEGDGARSGETGGDGGGSVPFPAGTEVVVADASRPVTDRPEPWVTLAAATPFAEPVVVPPARPRLSVPSRATVIRGEAWSQQIAATGFPAGPRLTWRFVGDVPDGLRLDDGRLSWAAGREEPIATHRVRVEAMAGPAKAFATVTVRVRDRNEPPRIAAIPARQIYVGERWEQPVAVTDDGPARELEFELVAGPDGLVVESGRLVWQPRRADVGRPTEAEIRVTDRGEPPLSATAVVSLTVLHDAEQTTEFVGAVRIDDVPAAYLIDRSERTRTVLREGERLTAGRFSAELVAIADDGLILEDGEARYRVSLGDRLSSRVAEDPR